MGSMLMPFIHHSEGEKNGNSVAGTTRSSFFLSKLGGASKRRSLTISSGFGVCFFSRLNDFSGGGFSNRKTFCDRSYARTGSSF